MAQIMKRGKTWYVRLQHKGKDVWRSTGETNRSKAVAKADEIVSEVKGTVSLSAMFDKVLDLLTSIADDTERDRTRRDFARRLLQGTTSKLLLSDAWATWLSNPRKGKRGDPKASTLEGYKAVWKRFFNFELDEKPKKHAKAERKGWIQKHHAGVKYLHEVTESMAEDYASDLWGSKMSPATYNAHVKFLRSMFKTLTIKGGLSVNPW